MQCFLVASVVLTTVLVEGKPYRTGLGYPSGMGRRNGMGSGMDLGYGGDGAVFDSDLTGAGMEFENGMGANGMGFENGMGATGMGFENGMGAAEMGMGNGMGYDAGMGGMGSQSGMGVGRGFGSVANQFANGQEFGSRRFNNGASGFGNQAIKNAGGKHYHNIGSHHKKVTSINQAEDDESHNIGGDSAFDSSAQAGKRFNNYQNGDSQYGNQYNQGEERLVFV